MRDYVTTVKSIMQSSFIPFAAVGVMFSLTLGVVLGTMGGPRALARDVEKVLSIKPAPAGAFEQLDGHWVGTFGDEFQFMRAEFVSTGSGDSGTLHLQDVGEFTAVKSSRMSDQFALQTKHGDEPVTFSGRVTGDVMIGSFDWALGRTSFHLHRVATLDRKRLTEFVGTYRMGSEWVRSIEDCSSELGWDQFIYVDHRNGARKALFPISANTFFFGSGFLIPDRIQGTVTFLKDKNGRSQAVLWEEAGSAGGIGERIAPEEAQPFPARQEGASLCKPLPARNPRQAWRE
jgi:hypothetical protein